MIDEEQIFRGLLPAPVDGRLSPYLREYQQDAVWTLRKAFERGAKMALDASDTGLGKTWVALELVKDLGMNFGVICPANIVTKWRHTAESGPFELSPEFVLSYEKIKSGRLGDFVSRYGRGARQSFTWNAIDDVFLIFDEVHVCSNHKSLNSKLLYAAIENPHIKILGISATASDSPLRLRTIGYGLELHDYKTWWNWCLRFGCRPGTFGGLEFNTGMRARYVTSNQTYARNKLQEIHQRIFPYRGCRVRKGDVLNQLPENLVIAEEVDVDLKHPLILDSVKEIDRKDYTETTTEIVALIRERQRLELGKIPIIRERAAELLEEGNSVIIFVNFTETIRILSQVFKGKEPGFSLVVGGMKERERAASISNFQLGHTRVCLCQSDAGGTSIDLDDTTGENPRAVLISPVYSARHLIQILGRAHRLTTKSKTAQWILFAAGTVEERACRLVQQKLNNLSLLNDGDLSETLKLTR